MLNFLPGSEAGVFNKESANVGGNEAVFYTIKNVNGLRATFSTLGATIASVKSPDKSGTLEEIVLGYDTPEGYAADKKYFGVTAGRYANRIAKGEFSLNGKTYKLPVNDGPNTLHGGPEGFSTKFWSPKIEGKTLVLSYVSKDGEQGFPGTLTATVRYTLTDADEIDIRISASTDADTIVNLTNHSYWNLNGGGRGTILDHELVLNADAVTLTDAELIPTGKHGDVAGTPFDFRIAHTIGERINDDNEALRLAGGYDHNFVLNGTGLRKAVDIRSPTSGRRLEISANQPGMQMYTSNDMHVKGHGGVLYEVHAGVAFEAQGYPDAPTHPHFPSTVLKPGDVYRNHIIFKLSAG
jgi:aldose 1-epimerase